MSAPKTSAVVGGDDRIRRFSRRTWIIGAASLVVVAVVVLGLWLGGVFNKPAAKAKSTTFTQQSQVDALTTDYQGNYTKAQQDLSNQINSLSSNSDKAQAYIVKASLAYNAAKYDEAKTYALKADGLMPTDVTADLLGNIAVKQNDKAAAAKYYQQAIDRLPKTAPRYGNKLQTYQDKLEAVRS